MLMLFILFIPGFAISQDLCPKTRGVPNSEASELKIEENELRISEAMKSISWLEKDMWDVIMKFKTTKELTDWHPITK